jgi:hypothetical protein
MTQNKNRSTMQNYIERMQKKNSTNIVCVSLQLRSSEQFAASPRNTKDVCGDWGNDNRLTTSL